jgi:hypothetical protein
MNALAQYMQQFQENAPRTVGNVQGVYMNDPYNRFMAQTQWARGQGNADLEAEDRRSMIDQRRAMSGLEADDMRSRIRFRDSIAPSFSQMPNFYGDGLQMPEYKQQQPYQFNALARMVR